MAGYIELCKTLGWGFHEQLHALLPEDPSHPQDDDHDFMVGQALVLGIHDGDAALALKVYNHWAKRAGYERLSLIGIVNHKWVIDIKTAVITIDEDYKVELVP